MADGIGRFCGDAVRITIRDRPGLVQIDQGRCSSWKISGNGAADDIIRPLTGDRHTTYCPGHGVISVKFKEIT